MNRRDLQFLQSEQEYPSVSIVVSTHRTMPEREGDPIRVKNAVSEAKKRLLKEYSANELKPLFNNLDDLVDRIDYTKLLDGLALFVNKDVKQLYILPVSVEDRVVIDSSFIIRDILYALNRMPRYWVLVLGEKPTRLYHGVGESLAEIVENPTDEYGEDQDGFPYDLLPPNADEEPKEGISGYTMRTSSNGVQGSHVHDSESYNDEQKKKFFERVDKLLSRFTSVDQLPLIIVGTERNCTLFKEITSNKNIVAALHGDYTSTSSTKLMEVVKPLLYDYLDEKCREKIEEFSEAIGRMHHAFGIDSVWRVAREGRIKDLLVEVDFSVPGVVNPDNQDDLIIYENSKAPGISDDLVNLLIEIVVEKGGRVVFCDKGSLDEYNHIAAILRY